MHDRMHMSSLYRAWYMGQGRAGDSWDEPRHARPPLARSPKEGRTS